MEDKDLVKCASQAKQNSYSPYSKFRVGAAILTSNDKLYTGANIENASFGATCCAERTAIFKAVSEGETKIKAVAIASDEEEYIYPCGICRQVLAEFCDKDTKVLCSNKKGEFVTYSLEELLPKAFTKFEG
ncbi:MAG: cytidine deaminase [Clostridiales bacterium]|nr:cytidine deaminase [Clostridiales bacterium]